MMSRFTWISLNVNALDILACNLLSTQCVRAALNAAVDIIPSAKTLDISSR